MSYLWDVAIKLKSAGYKISDIVFKQPEIFSPYMEVSFEDINFDFNSDVNSDKTIDVEINGFYRFLRIFVNLLAADFDELKEGKDILFDLIIHCILTFDVKQGYCFREYAKIFFYEEMKAGEWGEILAEDIDVFNINERNIIFDSIYNLYAGASGLYFFNVVLSNIFKNSAAYINKETEYGLFIYVGEEYSEDNSKKLNAIVSLFLPVKFREYICWDKHFPILGVDKTMQIENNVLF